MKYRDLVTLFVAIFFFLSLAYTVGVSFNVWPVAVILFISLVFIVYKLWIEK
jgi:hypothetical protein